jgi:hypothetical protein
MMEFDALDRALFALALEEPPSDLRSSILSATVYRPAPAFALWEVTLVGALAAVVVWLTVLVAMGGGALFVESFEAIVGAVVRPLSSFTTLTWLAAGVATALWLSFFTGSQHWAPAAERSAGSSR